MDGMSAAVVAVVVAGVEDVAVVVEVVVVVLAEGSAGVGSCAPSAASRFLASLAIRSELSPPPAPGSLNPPMPPNRLPTVAAGACTCACACASASGGVPSALNGALASGTAAAR